MAKNVAELSVIAGVYHSGPSGKNYIEIEPLMIGLLKFKSELIRSGESNGETIQMVVDILQKFLDRLNER